MALFHDFFQPHKLTIYDTSLTNLESQVEEQKKKQEIQFQNYVTHDPTEFAKAKREASDLSDQGSKVIVDNVMMWWIQRLINARH
jgi:hypothetical protein